MPSELKEHNLVTHTYTQSEHTITLYFTTQQTLENARTDSKADPQDTAESLAVTTTPTCGRYQ